MYYLDKFYEAKDDLVIVSPEQASAFAKGIAGDFNPLHDADNKRFCVPGDLLFAITLEKYGLSQKMEFNYTGMVGKEAELRYPTSFSGDFVLRDTRDKECLNAQICGSKMTDLNTIEAFTKSYVSFSGESFIDILVPLMKEKQMMVNVERPMVIYEKMSFEFDKFDLVSPTLEFTSATLDIKGKRGSATIFFDLLDQGEIVGTGKKSMVLSGLRPYDEDKLQGLTSWYRATKKSYSSSS
jgi:hypothetical protein